MTGAVVVEPTRGASAARQVLFISAAGTHTCSDPGDFSTQARYQDTRYAVLPDALYERSLCNTCGNC